MRTVDGSLSEKYIYFAIQYYCFFCTCYSSKYWLAGGKPYTYSSPLNIRSSSVEMGMWEWEVLPPVITEARPLSLLCEMTVMLGKVWKSLISSCEQFDSPPCFHKKKKKDWRKVEDGQGKRLAEQCVPDIELKWRSMSSWSSETGNGWQEECNLLSSSICLHGTRLRWSLARSFRHRLPVNRQRLCPPTHPLASLISQRFVLTCS